MENKKVKTVGEGVQFDRIRRIESEESLDT